MLLNCVKIRMKMILCYFNIDNIINVNFIFGFSWFIVYVNIFFLWGFKIDNNRNGSGNLFYLIYIDLLLYL